MTRIFTKTIARTAIVTALSASLAFSPITAAPAHAGEKEIGAIAAASFFALVTAGIIASAARENAGKATVDRHAPKASTPRNHRGPNRADPRKTLPSQCEFTINRGPDRGTYYGHNCLVRNFDYWPYLPDRCETRVKGRGNHSVKAYSESCLARYGYKEETGRPRSARR